MEYSQVNDNFGNFDDYEKFNIHQGQPSQQQIGYRDEDDDADSICSLGGFERPPLRKIDTYLPAQCPCIKNCRYTVAVMACLGFIISFGMKCNVPMAKQATVTVGADNSSLTENVAMRIEMDTITVETNNKTMSIEVDTVTLGTDTPSLTKNGPHPRAHHRHFNWTSAELYGVDSSFFWGYCITQIPAGFLMSRYPANFMFGLAIVVSSAINLINSMFFSRPEIFAKFRVLQGLVEGCIYPACHGIWRFWAPPLERSRLATIAFNGTYLGIVIGLPLSAILTDAIGYAASFVFYGLAGIVWYLCWLWLVFEKPSKHVAITTEELKYINKSLGQSVQLPMPSFSTTPFREIFHSMPVIAIIVANFCRSWNFYMLAMYQSNYLSKKFGLTIETTGFIGALPHIVMTIMVPIGGYLADYMQKGGKYSTTTVRKLFNCGGFGLEGFFFLIVAQCSTKIPAICALTVGVGFSAFAISGYNVNHLDIAPRYASILMGISNGIGTFAGIINPFVINYLNQIDVTYMFYLGAIIHLSGVAFYGVYASGELQPWAEPTQEQQSEWDRLARPPFTPVVQETAIDDYSSFNMTQKTAVNYGATEYTSGNPFLNPNLVQNAVQPNPTDSYMYGSVEERNY